MSQDRDQDYHMRRAREEMDRAYRADGWGAVDAHYRLSSLHMQRARALSQPAHGSGLDGLAARRLLLA